jgi:uncharacterized membrane protein (UPF0127 family)
MNPRIRFFGVFLATGIGLWAIQGCKDASKSIEGVATSSNASPASASNTPAYPPLPTHAQDRLQTIKLWIGPEQMDTELALNGIQQQTGMMFRTNIAENEGMLFVFHQPHQAAFWMKNTQVPLSAAYIDPEGVILEIHNLQPHDTNSVTAATDRVQYVLETAQGWFERHHIGTNTLIRTEHGKLSDSFTWHP